MKPSERNRVAREFNQTLRIEGDMLERARGELAHAGPTLRRFSTPALSALERKHKLIVHAMKIEEASYAPYDAACAQRDEEIAKASVLEREANEGTLDAELAIRLDAALVAQKARVRVFCQRAEALRNPPHVQEAHTAARSFAHQHRLLGFIRIVHACDDVGILREAATPDRNITYRRSIAAVAQSLTSNLSTKSRDELVLYAFASLLELAKYRKAHKADWRVTLNDGIGRQPDVTSPKPDELGAAYESVFAGVVREIKSRQAMAPTSFDLLEEP